MTEPNSQSEAEPAQVTSTPQTQAERTRGSISDQCPDADTVPPMEAALPGTAVAASSPSQPQVAAPLDQALQQLTRLADMFDDKMRYDSVKEAIIDKLHAELQQHRDDMLGRVLLPVLRDLIHLHGELLKFVDARRRFPEDKRDWSNLLSNVAMFGDDVIEILARYDVSTFVEEGVAYNPRTQRAISTVPNPDASADKTIAERLRPGFRWGEQMLQNEEVIVHTFHPEAASPDCEHPPTTNGQEDR